MPTRRRSATRSISRCSATAASITTAGTPARRRPRRPGSWERPSCPTVNDYKWELYNIAEDYSQNNDLAAKNPDKLKEMQALFLTEAAKYQVFPLDNSILPRIVTPRPSATAGRTVFTYSGENAGIPVGNAPSILNKDYTITAEVTIPEGGAEGMIVTLGGRFGGYGLYLLKGKPVFVYNFLDLERYRWEGGVGAAATCWASRSRRASTRIVFDFKYDGPGPGKGGTGVLTVDGKELAKKDDPAHDSVPHVHRRDLRHRHRYPHAGGRQLQAAVPLHRHDRQADLQARPDADDGGTTAGHGGTTRAGHGLAAGSPGSREPGGDK